MSKRFPNVFVNKKSGTVGKYKSYGIVTCYQINKDGIDVLVLWIALCSANCMLWSQLVSGITYVVQLLSERYKDIHTEQKLGFSMSVQFEQVPYCVFVVPGFFKVLGAQQFISFTDMQVGLRLH